MSSFISKASKSKTKTIKLGSQSTTSKMSKTVFEKSLGYPDASGMPNIRIPQFSPYTMQPAQIMHVKITSSSIFVELTDGRSVGASTTNLLPLCDLTAKERRKLRIADNATAVEWPEIGYKVTLRQLMGVE